MTADYWYVQMATSKYNLGKEVRFCVSSHNLLWGFLGRQKAFWILFLCDILSFSLQFYVTKGLTIGGSQCKMFSWQFSQYLRIAVHKMSIFIQCILLLQYMGGMYLRKQVNGFVFVCFAFPSLLLTLIMFCDDFHLTSYFHFFVLVYPVRFFCVLFIASVLKCYRETLE